MNQETIDKKNAEYIKNSNDSDFDKEIQSILKEELHKAFGATITSMINKNVKIIRSYDPLVNNTDPVNHPKHYTSHPSGIECIQITRWMCFNLGNAFKYIWRCDEKKDDIEDLEKAIWYIQDEINKRKQERELKK